MADERDETEHSEDPTQKRLDEALERGDVVKSQEVSTWFVIAGAGLVLSAFAGTTASSITTTLRGLVANAHRFLPGHRIGLVITSDDQSSSSPTMLGFRHQPVAPAVRATVFSSSRLLLPVIA